MRKDILSVLVVILFAYSCTSSAKKKDLKDNPEIAVIFETDMGNDIDDGLALDMLYKYLDQGKINLLGISVNKDNEYSPKFIDILNTWYGYPDIPVAMVNNGIEDTVPVNFAKQVCLYKKPDGTSFKRSLPDDHVFIESTRFYRDILSQQEDHSVIVISVGFLTNLARLLDTQGDDISPLTGRELVAKKVQRLSLMGGNFNGINPQEYNITKDVSSSIKVFQEWPTEITVSPFEVGNQILFPGNAIENNLGYIEEQPLVVAYKSYLPMPYDRPTWDLTCVLDEVESDKDYFSYSKQGKIAITSSGESLFEEDTQGKHRYIIIDEKQAPVIMDHFVELISSISSKHHL